MNIADLAQGEHWMDPEERQVAADLVHSFQQHMTERQIPETFFLVHRLRDFIVHHTLCLRLEGGLTPSLRPAPETGSPDPAPNLSPVLAGHIGRARSRLAKALKTLEDSAEELDPAFNNAGKSGRTAKKRPSTHETASDEPNPRNPLHDPRYIQNLIEEVGIDLNDPEFFADEDNFYDLPLEEQIRLRPESATKNPAAQAMLARLKAAANPTEPHTESNPHSSHTSHSPQNAPPHTRPQLPLRPCLHAED